MFQFSWKRREKQSNELSSAVEDYGVSLEEFFRGKNELVLEKKMCEQFFGAGSKLNVTEHQTQNNISGKLKGRDVI